MRILNVVPSLGIAGGERERGYRMSLALAARGHDVTVVTVARADGNLPDVDGRCRLVTLETLFGGFGAAARSRDRLRELVAWADIVHLLGYWYPLHARMHPVLRTSETPYVVCPAGSLPPWGRSKQLKQLFHAVIGRRLLKDASGVIAVTEDEKQALYDSGVRGSEIVVIPNGIDPGDYEPRPSTPIVERLQLVDTPYLLFLGRLNEIKGPDLLLEAFETIHRSSNAYKLVIAGPDGGLLDALVEYAQRAGIEDDVRFAGPVAGAEKIDLLRGASIVIVPSRREAMSIVALEAAMAEVPVLITDRCGLPEVGQSGGGKVVSASAEGIAAGLTSMLGDSESLREMGRLWRSFCVRRFSWDVIAERYVALYREILTDNR